MVTDPDERLRLTLTGRDLMVPVSLADEKRLRMWIDRFNADEKRAGVEDAPLDPDDDENLVSALLACAEAGLRVDEEAHGLSATLWGDVCSTEVAREMAR